MVAIIIVESNFTQLMQELCFLFARQNIRAPLIAVCMILKLQQLENNIGANDSFYKSCIHKQLQSRLLKNIFR